MKDKRLLAGITAILLCALVPLAALGEVTAQNTSDENGRLKTTVWEDENGQPAAGPEGYYSIQYSYKMDNTFEKYYDAEGQPFRVSGGYYGRRVMKDGKGNVTEIEYLDMNGDRTLNRQGYGMVTMAYFGFGALRSVFYYGLTKRQVVVPSLGYASILYEYSNKTMTGRTYRDEKGNPVDCADGYATVKQKLDKRFRVLSIRYDHANGKPATGPDGWFRCVKERDDKGRLTSVKYYDTNSQLTDRGAGYAWEEYTYEGENIVKVTRYDLNGTAVTDRAGVATVVREMKDDRITKERFLDRDGNRIPNDIGVGEIVYSYDMQGALEKVSYLDTEGSPVRCDKGYAGYRDEKDEDGATIRRTFLGTDGMPAEIAGGYSEIQYSYDEAKALTLTKYIDLYGKQIKSE